MMKPWRTAALALAACIAAGTALPASAKADGLVLTIDENGPRFDTYASDGDGPRGWRRDDDGWRGRRGGWERDRDERWDREDRWERETRWERRGPPRCSPERALDKAARLGLRRVRIRDIDRHTIEVSGRRFGERRVITFARAPSCPVIGW